MLTKSYFSLAALVVATTISCSLTTVTRAQHPEGEGCHLKGPELADFVRAVSWTRFETNKIRPRLRQCETFVGLIGERESEALQQISTSDVGANIVLREISKILEPRCSGPVNGLSSLYEFVGDCLELIELSEKATAPKAIGINQQQQQQSAQVNDRILQEQRDEIAELKSKLEEALAIAAHPVQVPIEGHVKVDLEPSKQRLVDREATTSHRETIKELMDKLRDFSQQLERDEVSAKLISEEKDKKIADLERGLRETAGNQGKLKELTEANAKLDNELSKLRLAEQETAANYERTILELRDVLSEMKAKDERIGTLERDLHEASFKQEKMSQDLSGSVHEIIVRKDQEGRVGIVLNSILGSTFVVFVEASSHAARAGLKFGDQVLAINGRAMAGVKTAEVLKLTGDEMSYLIKRTPFEQTLVLAAAAAKGSRAGFELSKGKVVAIEKDSPAARAGLLEDVSILTINGKYVVGLQDKEIMAKLEEASNAADGGEIKLTVISSPLLEQLTNWMKRAKKEPKEISDEGNKILEGAH